MDKDNLPEKVAMELLGWKNHDVPGAWLTPEGRLVGRFKLDWNSIGYVTEHMNKLGYFLDLKTYPEGFTEDMCGKHFARFHNNRYDSQGPLYEVSSSSPAEAVFLAALKTFDGGIINEQ